MNKLKINTYNKKLIKKVKNEVILTFDRLNIYNLIQKKKSMFSDILYMVKYSKSYNQDF